MPFKGQKNVYICPDCGHGFVSQDVDEGTTPFTTMCLHCGQAARSLFYKIPQQILTGVAAVQWYRPEPAEVINLTAAAREHVERGGLLRREVPR
jgi:uncharacterized Zn finger protein